MRVVLRIQNLAAGANDGSILRIAHLAVRRGECTVFAGLSTEQIDLLIRLITGVRSPDSGSIRILGTGPGQLSNDEEWFHLVDKMGIYADDLRESVSVAENLACIFRTKEKYRKEPALSSAVWRISRLVQISILELAGAMCDANLTIRMKVRLGRALAFHPEILILHPEGEGTEVTHDKMLRLIRRAIRRMGCSVVIFSSNPLCFERVADRVLLWKKGDESFIETKVRGWYHRLLPFLPPAGRSDPANIAGLQTIRNVRQY